MPTLAEVSGHLTVLRWGAGVNSTALAVGMAERGLRPDFVVFSDTGGEKPETYAYLPVFRRYLAITGFPELTVVKYKTRAGDTSLEDWCLRMIEVPSRAYGMGSCADKWKIRPMESWSTWEPSIRAARKAGRRPVCLIGYDAGEERRNRIHENKRWLFASPLIDWGWDRDDCADAIERAGLPMPPKSACYFCPSSTKPEILWLAEHHPELMAQALRIEAGPLDAGKLDTCKGLGRRFSWREFLTATEEERSLLPTAPVERCTMCVDDSDDR